jgi:hypothetical protein
LPDNSHGVVFTLVHEINDLQLNLAAMNPDNQVVKAVMDGTAVFQV